MAQITIQAPQGQLGQKGGRGKLTTAPKTSTIVQPAQTALKAATNPGEISGLINSEVAKGQTVSTLLTGIGDVVTAANDRRNVLIAADEELESNSVLRDIELGSKQERARILKDAKDQGRSPTRNEVEELMQIGVDNVFSNNTRKFKTKAVQAKHDYKVAEYRKLQEINIMYNGDLENYQINRTKDRDAQNTIDQLEQIRTGGESAQDLPSAIATARSIYASDNAAPIYGVADGDKLFKQSVTNIYSAAVENATLSGDIEVIAALRETLDKDTDLSPKNQSILMGQLDGATKEIKAKVKKVFVDGLYDLKRSDDIGGKELALQGLKDNAPGTEVLSPKELDSWQTALETQIISDNKSVRAATSAADYKQQVDLGDRLVTSPKDKKKYIEAQDTIYKQQLEEGADAQTIHNEQRRAAKDKNPVSPKYLEDLQARILNGDSAAATALVDLTQVNGEITDGLNSQVVKMLSDIRKKYSVEDALTRTEIVVSDEVRELRQSEFRALKDGVVQETIEKSFNDTVNVKQMSDEARAKSIAMAKALYEESGSMQYVQDNLATVLRKTVGVNDAGELDVWTPSVMWNNTTEVKLGEKDIAFTKSDVRELKGLPEDTNIFLEPLNSSMLTTSPTWALYTLGERGQKKYLNDVVPNEFGVFEPLTYRMDLLEISKKALEENSAVEAKIQRDFLIKQKLSALKAGQDFNALKQPGGKVIFSKTIDAIIKNAADKAGVFQFLEGFTATGVQLKQLTNVFKQKGYSDDEAELKARLIMENRSPDVDELLNIGVEEADFNMFEIETRLEATGTEDALENVLEPVGEVTETEDDDALLIKWEGGIRNNIYDDGTGIDITFDEALQTKGATIGVGHFLTNSEKASGTVEINGQQVDLRKGLTDRQVMDLFNQDNQKRKRIVNRIITRDVSKTERTVITSMVFNLGDLSVATPKAMVAFNKGDMQTFAVETSEAILDNGEVVLGLINRRTKELRVLGLLFVPPVGQPSWQRFLKTPNGQQYTRDSQ